jgi:L-ribulose-5-phosphate 3-epimerase
MHHIGIMQGRLVPPTDNRIQCFPRDNWKMEFEFATKANADCIEWIYDLYGADVNPLASNTGISEMKSLSSLYGIHILSVCADYFMDKPLVRANASELHDRLETLAWLMQRCQLLGMNRLVLPFVDASRIESDAEITNVCQTLEHALRISERTGIEIHLETSLAPDRYVDLLSRLPHPMLKVNYDSGNSSSLGYKPHDEFDAYGTRVGSVHIKDRLLGGGTVALGTGDTDFPSLFNCLERVRYSGDFILQVARSVSGDEISWAQSNCAFVLKYLQERS